MAFQHYCQCLYIKTFEGKGFQSSHCRHPPNNRWNLSTLAFILLLWNHVKAFRAPFFFLIRIFFTDTDDLQDSRGREGTIFYSSLLLPPAHEHWHLFATLHVRWISRIFNRNACIYQTATWWDLPPFRITIWVIAWWCNVCLFTWWIHIRFLLQRFDIGNLDLYYKRTD